MVVDGGKSWGNHPKNTDGVTKSVTSEGGRDIYVRVPCY